MDAPSEFASADPSSTVNMILKKAKTNLGKRTLMKKAPKLVEKDGKMCIMLHGGKSSQVLKNLVTDLAVMKKGECHKMTKKNDGIRPFEGGGETSLEFYAQKADAGAFVLGTDQKKRPDCLTVGRFFDYHLFDMVELLVKDYKGIREFGATGNQAVAGSRPCMVFVGDRFVYACFHVSSNTIWLNSGIRLLIGQPVFVWQKGVPQSMQRADCRFSSPGSCCALISP